jgi:hypothetical protein
MKKKEGLDGFSLEIVEKINRPIGSEMIKLAGSADLWLNGIGSEMIKVADVRLADLWFSLANLSASQTRIAELRAKGFWIPHDPLFDLPPDYRNQVISKFAKHTPGKRGPKVQIIRNILIHIIVWAVFESVGDQLPDFADPPHGVLNRGFAIAREVLKFYEVEMKIHSIEIAYYNAERAFKPFDMLRYTV